MKNIYIYTQERHVDLSFSAGSLRSTFYKEKRLTISFIVYQTIIKYNHWVSLMFYLKNNNNNKGQQFTSFYVYFQVEIFQHALAIPNL